MAIVGLACLTYQAISLKAWNIAVANLIGIGGYAYALHF